MFLSLFSSFIHFQAVAKHTQRVLIWKPIREFIQEKSRTAVTSRTVSGDLHDLMNSHVTSANIQDPSHSSARCAIDASPAQITWLSTWNATNRRARLRDFLMKVQTVTGEKIVVRLAPLSRTLLRTGCPRMDSVTKIIVDWLNWQTTVVCLKFGTIFVRSLHLCLAGWKKMQCRKSIECTVFFQKNGDILFCIPKCWSSLTVGDTYLYLHGQDKIYCDSQGVVVKILCS